MGQQDLAPTPSWVFPLGPPGAKDGVSAPLGQGKAAFEGWCYILKAHDNSAVCSVTHLS